MNILLVNPPRFKGIPVIREERCEIIERYSVIEPYTLLQVAAILRNDGHEVYLIDANGQNLSYSRLEAEMRQTDYDALIFRFCATTFDWDMKTAEISKKINSDAVTIGRCFMLENFERELMAEAPHMDVYIRNEFEVVSPVLIKALDEGKDLAEIKGLACRSDGDIKINPPAEPLSDYDSLPLPAFDLLPDLDPYFENTPAGKPFTIIYTSRGCPFRCSFCVFVGKKWNMKSPERVIEELRYLKRNYDIKTVSFFDETFTIDRERVVKICNAITSEKMDLTWYCNSRVNLVDEELLDIMRQAGCRGISFGIESGNQHVLDSVDKGVSVEQSEKAIKMVKAAGIKCYCSFVFGLPGETEETINETMDFIKRTLPTGAQFNVSVPYPNTQLYDLAVAEGWVPSAPDWRELYEFKSMMGNGHLNSQQIEAARLAAYRTLYTSPRWYLQNIAHVIRNPEDFSLAARYVIKIFNNLFRKMKYAH
jgi:anaerobic magnesium-protoporphyrin IX monomethyl ester cyclase